MITRFDLIWVYLDQRIPEPNPDDYFPNFIDWSNYLSFCTFETKSS